MKALTLWQPWATLVALGEKQHETRSWSTNYRGPLAIHAAKTAAHTHQFWAKHFQRSLQSGGYHRPKSLPYGMVVAICQLVDIVPTSIEIVYAFDQKELAFGDYSPHRFVWKLEDIVRLTDPIPATGRQKLWTWDVRPLLEGL